MQHQANLTTLGTARLHLFKTICLPSIIHQTSYEFLWIIKIDPDLDTQIRKQLIDTIHHGLQIEDLSQQGRKHSLKRRIFVIGSNVNFNYGAWRGGKESEEILSNHAKGRIFMGDVDLVKLATREEPMKIILETRLDADDGIDSNYVSFLQQQAKDKFREQNNGKIFKWFYWCTEKNFKWYVSAEGKYGQIGGELNDKCITPGLTTGFNVGTLVRDVPTYSHHRLLSRLKGNISCIKQGDTVDETSKREKVNEEGLEDKGTKYVLCVDFVSEFVGAVRARTATSAGMNDVTWQNNQQDSNKLWKLLQEKFGIMTNDALVTKQYFEEKLVQIAKENLEGQCRPGHSCKESSQIKLKKVIERHEIRDSVPTHLE